MKASNSLWREQPITSPLKERLQRELGPEYERFLELAGELREPLA